MLGNGGLVAIECLENPRLGGSSIRHGFLCRKGLGSHQKKGRFRVASLQNLGNVRSIDIGAKVHLEVALGIRLEGLADHDWTQVTSCKRAEHKDRV